MVDIDGVVADVRHRLHHVERRPKDWKAFFAAADRDGVHPEGAALVQVLTADHDVVFLTGRPAHLERVTRRWLERHGMGGHRLIMRPGGDHRPAAVLKVERLRQLADEADVQLVVDDDPLVLAAVEAAGFTTMVADWERRSREEAAALQHAQEDEGRT